jgi:hypothetical protein
LLDALIVLFSFYGLTWTIKESEIFSVPRNWLISKSVFAFKLLDCYFCTGFWCGIAVYLLHEPAWNLKFLFLWGLASASVSFIVDALVTRLWR